MKLTTTTLPIAILALSSSLNAASVAVTSNVTAEGTVTADNNLIISTEGTTDWVNLGAIAGGTDPAARSEMTSTTHIGPVVVTDGTAASWNGSWKQSWIGADGSLASATNVQSSLEVKPIGAFSTAPLGSLDFDVTGLSAGIYKLNIYATQFQVAGLMSVNIGGTSDTATINNSDRFSVFTVDFEIGDGETMNVSYKVDSPWLGLNSNVGISAITLAAAPIPEPSVGILTGLAGLMLVFRRTKR